MPTAIVKISDDANKVINVVKARYGLKDKSEAINKMAELYDEMYEPELRPAFIRKMRRIAKEKAIPVEDFDRHFGMK